MYKANNELTTRANARMKDDEEEEDALIDARRQLQHKSVCGTVWNGG